MGYGPTFDLSRMHGGNRSIRSGLVVAVNKVFLASVTFLLGRRSKPDLHWPRQALLRPGGHSSCEKGSLLMLMMLAPRAAQSRNAGVATL